MRKILQFVCGVAVLVAFLSVFGAVGAYEVGNITGGECVALCGVRMALCGVAAWCQSLLVKE